MDLGFIGLGRMGLRMVKRLLTRHNVVAYDLDEEKRGKIEDFGGKTTESLAELAEILQNPRNIWMMVPAGNAVSTVIQELEPLLDFGDVIMDGGNSFYKDSMRIANSLQKKGINFLDVGTSGGLLGAEQGASLTIGGPKDAYERVKPLFNTIARPNAHLYCGPSGAGHFVKMIHNGIEYAMLQSIGEGFEMLRQSQFDLNLEEIAKVWNNGCVIRSWLMEITAKVFNENPRLDNIKGEIGGGETGRWMIETALEKEISTPIIALSLLMRYRSRQQDTFAGKIVAALRNKFGGHSLKRI